MASSVTAAGTSRRLTLFGLVAAGLGPFTFFVGTVAALVVAAMLWRRGERQPAALLAVAALLAPLVVFILIQGLFMPVNTGPIPISG
jgi:hypothetical protein